MSVHRTDAAVLVLALLAILALAGWSRVAQPPTVSVAEAAAREGERVAVEGLVLRAAPGPKATSLSLAQDGARLDAIGPPQVGLVAGDTARLVGVVARGDSSMVLSVERATLLVPAATRPLEPAALALHPADHDGARVLVEGEPDKGALVGRDGTRLALGGAPAPGPGWWLANGTFSYHADKAAYVLEVHDWTRASS